MIAPVPKEFPGEEPVVFAREPSVPDCYVGSAVEIMCRTSKSFVTLMMGLSVTNLDQSDAYDYSIDNHDLRLDSSWSIQYRNTLFSYKLELDLGARLTDGKPRYFLVCTMRNNDNSYVSIAVRAGFSYYGLRTVTRQSKVLFGANYEPSRTFERVARCFYEFRDHGSDSAVTHTATFTSDDDEIFQESRSYALDELQKPKSHSDQSEYSDSLIDLAAASIEVDVHSICLSAWEEQISYDIFSIMNDMFEASHSLDSLYKDEFDEYPYSGYFILEFSQSDLYFSENGYSAANDNIAAEIAGSTKDMAAARWAKNSETEIVIGSKDEENGDDTPKPTSRDHVSPTDAPAQAPDLKPVGRPSTVAKAGEERKQVSFLVSGTDYELVQAFAKAHNFKSVAAAARFLMIECLGHSKGPK